LHLHFLVTEGGEHVFVEKPKSKPGRRIPSGRRGWTAPQKYRDLFKEEDMILRPNVPAGDILTRRRYFGRNEV
jgi:hypothetical protein